MKPFLIIFLLVSSIFADGFNYEGGPASWIKHNPSCNGSRQSPINFDSINDKPSAPIINTIYNTIYNTDNFKIENKGHTIELTDFLGRSSIAVDGKTYSFQQVHFHTPSEHHIDGKHYDAEAHFVFKQNDNDLSVIGVLYSVSAGGFSEFFNSIQNLIPSKGNTWTWTPWHNRTADLTSVFNFIIPRSPLAWAYKYSGSLTTPPCNETVTWLVATKILPISVDQLIDLRDLIGYSSRPIQPRP